MASGDFFVMIKPDGVERRLVGTIVTRFENKGFILKKIDMRTIDEEMAQLHYAEHEGRHFFPDLLKFTTSGPVIAMVWEGNIEVARKIVGATVPWEAEVGTIRGDYVCSMPANLIHCSDSAESAERECGLWFPTI